MALGFLRDIASKLSPFADVLRVGGSLYDVFRGHKARSAEDMRAMLGAAVDPDDPRFRNLRALFEAEGRARLLEGINEAMRLENRARARGVSVVNPERRDEARYKAISRGFQDIGRQAGVQAQQALTGTGTAMGGLVPYDVGRDALTSQHIGALTGGIADILSTFKPQPKEFEYFRPDENPLTYSELL